MKKLFDYFIHYITKDSAIEPTLFKILGISGIVVSLISGTQTIVSGISLFGGLIDYAAALLSVLLLWFVDKTQKYVIGYLLTQLGVFMALFAVLFFDMGGMSGSMTYFFSFGLVFSFLMFKGVLLIVMESLELGFYIFLCLFAYFNPSSVTPFETARDQFIDQVVGIVISGIGIGLIFLVYIQQYEKQERIAKEASQAKSNFLANMSHELRTPINMMLGINEVISRETNDDAILEYTAKARTAGSQLLSQVNQLLDFSRIDAGKGSVKSAPYNINTVLDSLKSFYEKEAANKNIVFLLNADSHINANIKGDVQKVTQILTNLVSNAIKYTPTGSVTLNAALTSIDETSETILFSVVDTGIGIKPEEIGKIFGAFERADLNNNRNIEGTGLGLPIAQSFAKTMGSQIEVTSTYGKGSCFSFSLTQALAGESDKVRYEVRGTSFIAPDAKLLAVDDNGMNLDVVKSLLKRTLINVDTAMSCDECVNKVKEKKYDLILLDYMMPIKDGIETLHEVKELEWGRNIPIVVLTADASEGKKELLLNEGFDAYLSKPIESSELEGLLIDMLPANLVTRTTGYSEVKEAVDFVTEEADKLKPCDIDLFEGVRHFGNDLPQFIKIAGIFVSGSDEIRNSITTLSSSYDYEGLIFKIHSLKGNSGNVGAIELRATSAKIEEHLRRGDYDYLEHSKPFLLFALDRVVTGLKCLIEDYRVSAVRKILEAPESDSHDDDDLNDMFSKLADALELSNQILSNKLLDRLIPLVTKDMAEVLYEIKKNVSEIEFDEASNKLNTLLSK